MKKISIAILLCAAPAFALFAQKATVGRQGAAAEFYPGIVDREYSFEFSFTTDEIHDFLSGKKKSQKEVVVPSYDEGKDAAPSAPEPEELDKDDIERMKALAEKGNADFQYFLARCYARGRKVDQDYKQALFWYEKAASQGLTKAQNNLACLYLDGKGVDRDVKKAAYWFEQAAEQNDKLALLNLGCMWEEGDLGQPDYAKAFDYYQKSDKLGCSYAADKLGHCWENGTGTKANPKKAFACFKKAADMGYYPAYCEVGRLYLEGIGVKKDAALAKKYLEAADEKGVGEAKELLKKLQ